MTDTDTSSSVTAMLEAEKARRNAGTHPTLIPIAKLRPFEDQDRAEITSESLSSLKASFRQRISESLHPNIEPLHVAPNDDDTFVIHAGERRYRAAIELEYKGPLLCLTHPLTTEQKSDVMLLSNFAREDLNPIDLSNAIGTRIDSGLWDKKRAIELTGLERTSLGRLLALRTLPDSVQSLAKDGVRKEAKFLIRLSQIPEPTLSNLINQIRKGSFRLTDLEQAEAQLSTGQPESQSGKAANRKATKYSIPAPGLRRIIEDAPSLRRIFKEVCRDTRGHSRLEELSAGQFVDVFKVALDRFLQESSDDS